MLNQEYLQRSSSPECCCTSCLLKLGGFQFSLHMVTIVGFYHYFLKCRFWTFSADYLLLIFHFTDIYWKLITSPFSFGNDCRSVTTQQLNDIYLKWQRQSQLLKDSDFHFQEPVMALRTVILEILLEKESENTKRECIKDLLTKHLVELSRLARTAKNTQVTNFRKDQEQIFRGFFIYKRT